MADEGADAKATCVPKYNKYDVYISFAGKDTRQGIVSHLSNALRREGLIVHTDEELRVGDDIGPSLFKAIEESRISIVILSENYASSKWCLDELERILGCRKMNNQLVCPIFYHVEPSDVRYQRGIYGEAIGKYESRFGSDHYERVQKWREALKEVANLSGFHQTTGYEEHKLIEDIVKWVTLSLSSFPIHDVYLSFTGQDILLTLRDSLNHALLNNGFRAFINDGSMKSGYQTEFSFIKAIENSRIAIVVFSENFASSAFCLHQLVKILECNKMKNLLVYPIFYNVDPSHVWHQKGSYGEAMARHEWRFGSDSGEVQKWRSALTKVADLSGWHFKSGDQQENELIEGIVKWVTKSLPSLPRNDVFLSFSGVDTPFLFTSQLYNALRQAGFETFMNEEALEGEDKISSSLINAIEQSRLSIIVFSENYGYSSCCLDQLVKILECMEMKNQQVWPIFYKVESSDLRHQRKTYGKAMAAHESKFGKDSEKVRKWRSALSEVAYLRGWHFKTGSEYEFIQRIVKNAINI